MSTSIKWITEPVNVLGQATVEVWQLHVYDGEVSTVSELSNPENFQQDFNKTYSYTLSGRFPNATNVKVLIDGSEHGSSTPTDDGFVTVSGVLL